MRSTVQVKERPRWRRSEKDLLIAPGFVWILTLGPPSSIARRRSMSIWENMGLNFPLGSGLNSAPSTRRRSSYTPPSSGAGVEAVDDEVCLQHSNFLQNFPLIVVRGCIANSPQIRGSLPCEGSRCLSTGSFQRCLCAEED